MFKSVGYTIHHSMAMSFLIPTGDCLGSRELNEIKKMVKKIHKKELAGESLPAR